MNEYFNPPPLEERPESEGNVAHMQDVEETPQRIAVPEGYKDIHEFITEARDLFAADLEFDRDNREKGLADLHFLAIDQWDERTRKDREEMGRPCFTVNTMPQFIGQVVGDRRMNKTSIKLVPKKDATVEMAEIRAGIIRNIEYNSKAERVYDAGLEDQVSGGIGNWRVTMEYASDDVFEQDIFIRQIPNAFSVVWDRMAVDPTGNDAQHCFVQDLLPRKVYEKKYGDISPIPSGFGSDTELTGLYGASWMDKDDVRITEYWRLKKRPAKLVMLKGGAVVHWNASLDPNTFELDPKTGQPLMRDTHVTYACMYLINGWDILEGPYELPLTRLPIIRVNGREFRVGEKRVRFGLVRWAREPAQMRNYWRSVAIETLAMAPQNQWTAEARSVKGREDDFREAHLKNDPLLVYNDNTPKPEREQGPKLSTAVLQEVAMNNQDIKDTTGIQDASLGIRSNEVSGKAIMARQHEGDVATVIYHDNLAAAIEETGIVVDQLLNICYDTTRTLRSIGSDEKAKLVRVNDPMDPNSFDISRGEYDVSVVTGPSFTTQRMFAAEAMLETMKVAPQLMQVAGDILVEAQDWPKATEIAQRLKKVMPPELTKDPDQPPTPEEIQAMQQEAEKAQLAATQAAEQAELQTRMSQLGVAEQELAVKLKEEEYRKAVADADKAESEAERAEMEVSADAKLAGLRVGREAADLIRGDEATRSASDSRDRPSSSNSGSQSGRQSRRPKPRKK